MRPRVVIAGLGDTGLLVAIHLGRGLDVVGVTTKPCLVSGQELGTRLARPEVWKQHYLMAFDRYRKLDDVRVVQGRITELDAHRQRVRVTLPDGREQVEPYDVVVVASGVTNGFWRTDALQNADGVADGIHRAAAEIAATDHLAVVGGGATGASVAANVKETYPEKSVDFFYSEDQPLPGYHPRVRHRMVRHLERAGVVLHPGHRAVVPANFACDRLTTEPIHWSTGQPPFEGALTLWAVGRLQPNNAFVPEEMLDERGFVRTDEYLRVPGYDNVFAVGDIAASDPHRSSARNWGYRLVAHNIHATLEGRPASMKRYSAPAYRWGSILGLQQDGMRVFQPNGRSFRFPAWAVRQLVFPIAVGKVIYRGIRADRTSG